MITMKWNDWWIVIRFNLTATCRYLFGLPRVMSACPLSKMTTAQKEQTETSAPEIYHNNQIAGFLNWTSLIQYTICPEWHDMITKLAWLLLQHYCMKSASSGNQIKIDIHKKKNALWCTMPQLQILHLEDSRCKMHICLKCSIFKL